MNASIAVIKNCNFLELGSCTRYYNPETGRFLSEDKMGIFSGDTNNYRYVGNSPMVYSDPYGLYKYTPSAGDPFNQCLEGPMSCMDRCTNRDLWITAGKEGGHGGGSTGPHAQGDACDVGKNSNSGLDRSTVERCYGECFDNSSSFGQEEGNHYHFQCRPGRGGATGFAPGVH